MTIPEKWKPLQIKGDGLQGRMTIGDSDRLMMSVRWLRTSGKKSSPRFEFDRATRGLTRKKMDIDTEVKSVDFPLVSWAPDTPVKKGRLGVFLGYSESADFFIELLFNAETNMNIAKIGEKKILSSLRCNSLDEPTRWCLFNVGFITPAGFVLVGRKLDIGDMSLLLKKKGGERLMLRQVYPSELALARREKRKWLIYNAYKEHRRFHSDGELEEMTLELREQEMQGVRRTGVKKLPFPLGIILPRRTEAILVEDTELERLLIAEYDAPKRNLQEIAADSIVKMNWQLNQEESRDA